MTVSHGSFKRLKRISTMARNKNQNQAKDLPENKPTPDVPQETIEAVSQDVTTPDSPVVTEVQIVSPTASDVEEKSAKQTSPLPESQVAANLRVELDSYAETMAPGNYVTEAQGAQQQTFLCRLMQRVVNRISDEEFESCMETLLNWFDEHRQGVTSDNYRGRFAASLTMTEEEIQFFNRVGMFLFLVSDKKLRQTVLKDMSIDYYTEIGFTENGRQRFLQYFGF